MLAAAGSAVGLGNIWRFPYLAAKDGGGTFILVYIVLALTFGFTLLTTDIAIGRKTGQSPLVAYGKIHPGWNGLGLLASIVPVVILPYYCSHGLKDLRQGDKHQTRAGRHTLCPHKGKYGRNDHQTGEQRNNGVENFDLVDRFHQVCFLDRKSVV